MRSSLFLITFLVLIVCTFAFVSAQEYESESDAAAELKFKNIWKKVKDPLRQIGKDKLKDLVGKLFSEEQEDVFAESESFGTCQQTTTALNMRSGPGTNYGIIKTLAAGTRVDVESSSNGWAKLSGGYYYVSQQYLTGCPGSTCMQTTTALNVRNGPGTNYGVSKTLPTGTRVTVESTSNGWASLGGGQYVSSQYLTGCGSAPAPGGSYDCGMAYTNGAAIGHVNCVKIDGEAVTTDTAAAFNRMKSAAAGNGVALRINSGFRTMAEQEYYYNCYITKKCNNGNLAAKPGYSNHQNGKALDINTSGGAYNWLVSHGSAYGFVRTVPSETWHWEYRPGTRCNAFVSYSCN